MNPDHIDDSEMLYRAGAGNEIDIKTMFDGKRPTAAFFIDAGGLSVDRQGDRTESEVDQKFRERFRRRIYVATVKIGAGACREVGTYPIPAPSKKNRFHAEIWNSESVRQIELIKAMQLAELCSVVS